MKFVVCFKTPDALWHSLQAFEGPDEDSEELSPREQAEEFASKWTDGETIRVEFDTEAETATVGIFLRIFRILPK